MIGTWRWNLVMGLVGAALTMLFSIGKNPLDVMLLRSLYAFIAFVVLAFILRAAISIILQPPAMNAGSELAQAANEEGKGTALDLYTPDEGDDINELLKAQLGEGSHSTAERTEKADQEQQQAAEQFRPLNPPQLLSTENKDPEQLVKAIRHLTGG
ncbi:hypothetical protein [Paenibacillus radicis (ex Gao et al. 2016)]|uniref:Uncharacterized protein n=1 Tax=Paenibacillus radicis (ex Gao et al. 2016) TaxID=1737354 RepID=A0A917M7U1_9BACL|nr:hypothetical protein [Paenibacillus radicis (ex Gao et al. 2016)]GGG80616.1 hypothetical protein GCM10010918_42220 [Paenibacillus radicis (ex Gao et al. 2016)]